MINTRLTKTLLGKGFADYLETPVIHVSQEISFTRREIVEKLGCPNFIAAARLEKVLKRLKIFSISKLYRLDPISLARCKGIGQASMYVAMCILDYKGYSVPKWWKWEHGNGVTFTTLKQRGLNKASKRKHEV